MKENLQNPQNNLEQEARINFKDFVEIQTEVDLKISNFESETIVVGDNEEIVEEHESNLRKIEGKYSIALNKLGLSLITIKEHTDNPDWGPWSLDSFMTLKDMQKFSQQLSNLPSNFLNIKNENRFAYGIVYLFDREIKDFNKTGEMTDYLLDLKNYSKKISAELKRVFKSSYETIQEDTRKFLNSYEDAFKENYFKELVSLYSNDLIKYPVENSQDFYNSNLTYQVNLADYAVFKEEVKKPQEIKVVFQFIDDRMFQIIDFLNILSPQMLDQPLIKNALNIISQQLEIYYGVLPLIKQLSLKEKYKLFIEKSKTEIEKRIKALKQN